MDIFSVGCSLPIKSKHAFSKNLVYFVEKVSLVLEKSMHASCQEGPGVLKKGLGVWANAAYLFEESKKSLLEECFSFSRRVLTLFTRSFETYHEYFFTLHEESGPLFRWAYSGYATTRQLLRPEHCERVEVLQTVCITALPRSFWLPQQKAPVTNFPMR